MIYRRKLPCGCVEFIDKRGREGIQLCPACEAEHAKMHAAAVASCSHVARAHDAP